MRQIRIYQPGDYQPGDVILLSDSAAHHAGTVLRLGVGDFITLFCDNNTEYAAVLSEIHKKSIRVHILQAAVVNRESPRIIHLAQAMTKGDKMEWIIQKAVELGVHSITPLITERCVVKLDADRLHKKQQQWQAIAIGACEQSGRNRIPLIHPSCDLDYFLQHCSALKLTLSPHAEEGWPIIPDPSTALALIIGPEGGLSPQEIQKTLAFQAHTLRLGPRTLRTETAAIAALSLLQMRYGDIKP